MPKPDAANERWLTLEQASQRLGIHASTLRRWANQGAIEVFLTPGGHRRFLSADLERFQRERRRPRLPAPPAQPRPSDCAIARTITHVRHHLQEQPWLAAYGEAEREANRHLGRRLIGLLLQYAVRPDQGIDQLAEARAIGAQHAQAALRVGQPLVDLLQAVSFFRTALLEVTVLHPPGAGPAQPQTNVRLLRTIEELLAAVQAGVVECYLHGGGITPGGALPSGPAPSVQGARGEPQEDLPELKVVERER